MLSATIFLPLAAAVALLFLPGRKEGLIRRIALAASLAALAGAALMFLRFDAAGPAFQFAADRAWLGAGIRYQVGLDGISLVLVALTAVMTPLALASSWGPVRERVKEFSVLMLVLETGLLGVFAARDLVLFYVFWEAVLVPMAFVIGIWGGRRRLYASVKFVLFTMLGSLLMLGAILVLQARLRAAGGGPSFALADLAGVPLPPGLQVVLFLAFTAAFAVKVPLVPVHTWLPDAHVEAPTAGSVLLAAVLLKMGAYGFVRLAVPLFPAAAHAVLPALRVLAAAGIVYGGLMALAQDDMKSLVAYSSVSHMGLVCLALFTLTPEGVAGGLLQMVNHGVSTGALFLCVGMLYERTHSRLIADHGGVARVMPVFSALFLVSALSSMGLPGLNGFAGEILCLFGVFRTSTALGIAALTTVLLSAGYLLWLLRRVLHGPVAGKAEGLRDIGWREVLLLAPLLALMIGLGVAPSGVLRKIEPSVTRFVRSATAAPPTVSVGSKPIRAPSGGRP